MNLVVEDEDDGGPSVGGFLMFVGLAVAAWYVVPYAVRALEAAASLKAVR